MSTISDPFTDTDGTLLSAHAFPGGFTWVRDARTGSGDMEITSNQVDVLGASGDSADYRVAGATPGSADCTVRVFLNTTGAIGKQYVDLIARAQGGTVAGDRYVLRLDPFALKATIIKRISGTDTSLSADTDFSGYVSGQSVEFILSGSSLSCNVNGSTFISAVTDTSISATGAIGLGCPFTNGDSPTSSTYNVTTFECDCAAGFGGGGGGGPTSSFVFRHQTTRTRRGRR